MEMHSILIIPKNDEAPIDDKAIKQDKIKSIGLSPRETEVGYYLIKGFSNREIGLNLHITVKCVKFHLTNIYKKLKVKNRTQAAIKIHDFTSYAWGANKVSKS